MSIFKIKQILLESDNTQVRKTSGRKRLWKQSQIKGEINTKNSGELRGKE